MKHAAVACGGKALDVWDEITNVAQLVMEDGSNWSDKLLGLRIRR